MNASILLRWLLVGLIALTTLPTKAAISIGVKPNSATYSVGQTLFVTLYGGIPGTTYTVSALVSSTGTALSSVSITGGQSGNTVTWADGQTEATLIVRFLAGAEGDGRVLQVRSNTDPNDTDQTGELSIISGPTVTLSPAAARYGETESVTLTVSGGIEGKEYILQLYEGHPEEGGTDLSGEITNFSSQTATNTIVWTAGGSSEQFFVRFDEGSAGTNRRFVVGDEELTHLALSDVFVIGDCKPVVNVQLATGGVLASSPGAVLYEFMQVLDRLQTGYEIRQTETNTTGIYKPSKSGVFTVTVTGADGCKTTVTATMP